MASDEELAVSEMAALARLLEQHAPRLLAMLRRRIDPGLAVRVDPEEILQEAFLAARRKWRDFLDKPEITPYVWLYRIAVDCLIEAWRREARPRRDFHQEMPWPERSSVQLGLHLVASGTSPSAAAARAEAQERVRSLMERLSGSDQEILWMRHFDGLSFREAGMVLGITENAATVRYARALRRLKDQWERQEEGPRA